MVLMGCMKSEAFKICPFCHQAWPTLEEFLSDPELRLTGYQASFEDLLGGLFMFTHISEKCGTTLSIPVQKFVSLSDRPIVSKRTEQTECCPQICQHKNNLGPCPVECECTWVREVLQKIQEWSRKAA